MSVNLLEDLIHANDSLNALERRGKAINQFFDNVEIGKQPLYDQITELKKKSSENTKIVENIVELLRVDIEKYDHLRANWNFLMKLKQTIYISDKVFEKLAVYKTSQHLTPTQKANIELLLMPMNAMISRMEELVIEQEDLIVAQELSISGITQMLGTII